MVKHKRHVILDYRIFTVYWGSLEFPSPCHGEDHGFESRMDRQFFDGVCGVAASTLDCESGSEGSIPSIHPNLSAANLPHAVPFSGTNPHLACSKFPSVADVVLAPL